MFIKTRTNFKFVKKLNYSFIRRKIFQVFREAFQEYLLYTILDNRRVQQWESRRKFGDKFDGKLSNKTVIDKYWPRGRETCFIEATFAPRSKFLVASKLQLLKHQPIQKEIEGRPKKPLFLNDWTTTWKFRLSLINRSIKTDLYLQNYPNFDV